MPRLCTPVAATVLLALLCAGCGEQDSAAQDPGGSTSSPTTSPTTSPTKGADTGATKPPSEALEKVRVVGQVAQTGDCVVVRDDNDITWTIAGELAVELRLHDRVQVTGAPDLTATGCGGSVVKATDVTVLPPVE